MRVRICVIVCVYVCRWVSTSAQMCACMYVCVVARARRHIQCGEVRCGVLLCVEVLYSVL